MKIFLLIPLLLLLGCPCPPCVRPILPTEPHPTMSQDVETNDAGGLDEKELTDLLEDFILYQGALDRCNDVILKYNKAVK